MSQHSNERIGLENVVPWARKGQFISYFGGSEKICDKIHPVLLKLHDRVFTSLLTFYLG